MSPSAYLQSLGTKFIALVVVVLVSVLTVVTYIYMQAQQRQLSDSLFSKGEALGRFVSLIAPKSILTYDFEGMNDFMREVSREQDVVYGVLVANNGIRLTHYLDHENDHIRTARAQSGEKDNERLMALVEKDRDLLVLHFPILSGDGAIGEFRLGMSRKRIKSQYRKTLTAVLGGYAALLLLISGSIYVGFRYMALRPITELNLALNEVGAGVIGRKLIVSSSDEIGSLTASFNAMVAQLDSSNREKDQISDQLELKAAELGRLNKDLERRVEESSHIMRDLHDDVGAKLLTLAHRSENESNAQTARAALQTLRQTIRGLEVKDVTIRLCDALADWRGEAAERLDAAGIAFNWQQPDEVGGLLLNNRQQINLGQIIREAISNAISHAQANAIGVFTQISELTLIIGILDNGLRTDPKNWTAGTGLNNMHRRAEELGGQLRIQVAQVDGQAGPGSCVEVRCPLGEIE